MRRVCAPLIVAAALISRASTAKETCDKPGSPEQWSAIEERLSTGETLSARTLSERIVDEARRADDRHLEAWGLEYLGNALFYQADFPGALECFEASRKLMMKAGDAYGLACAAKDAGTTCRYLGKYDSALRYLDEAVRTCRPLGRDRELASAIENRGMVFQAIGDRNHALELYVEAEELWRKLRDPSGTQEILVRIGSLYQQSHNLHAAADCFMRAAAVDGGTLLGRIWVLSGLSCSLSSLGREQEAIEACSRAVAVARQASYLPGEATNLLALARLHDQRDPVLARKYIDEAIAVYSSIPLPWWGMAELGYAHRLAGNLDMAIECGEKAAAEFEKVRGGLAAEASRLAVLDRNYSVYQDLIASLMARHESDAGRGDDLRAFEVSEQARARETVEAITRAGHGDGSRRSADAIKLPEAHGLLDDTSAIVAYATAHESVFALVISRGSFRAIRMNAACDELASRVLGYVELLARGAPAEEWQRVSRRLYRELVEPARTLLSSDITRLTIVPDTFLCDLPFETLVDPRSSRPLIRDFAVSYAPSVTALVRIRSAAGHAKPADDLIAFANPTQLASPRDGDVQRGSPAWLPAGPPRFDRRSSTRSLAAPRRASGHRLSSSAKATSQSRSAAFLGG